MHDSNHGTKNGAANKHVIKSFVFGSAMLILLASTFSASAPTSAQPVNSVQPDPLQDSKREQNSGTLLALSPTGERVGEFPLKHTSVDAKVSGYVASVTVKQEFQNPYKKKIEAIYSFPLSDSGAVDEMTMKVNGHVIHGRIKTKEEARETYERAKSAGLRASILDLDHTNNFMQSVANIEPGESIIITLHYEELLTFESGNFTFTFPMGSRFTPGRASDQHTMEPGELVPIASKDTRQRTTAGTGSGNDISINVDIDSGIPVTQVRSQLHAIRTQKKSGNETIVSLINNNEIPKKDFILSWNVSSDQIKSGYLTHKDPQSKEGVFTLMLMPPKTPSQKQISAKEMIFLIDCSGSQEGAPLQKAKEILTYTIDHMNPDDTFQIIAFGHHANTLFEKPEKVSPVTKWQAHNFIDPLVGSFNEGTWMTSAVDRVLSTPNEAHRLRIVTFMTDGYMGYDQEVIGLIRKYQSIARWFPFGPGNWVNQAFLHNIAKMSGGEPDFVPLNSSAPEFAKKFYDRIAAPVLTEVKVDFGNLKVTDVFPREVADVWAQRPLYFQGRYTQPGSGTVTLSGYAAGKPYKEILSVILPDSQPENAVLAPLWARAKVDALMSENYLASLGNEPGYEGGGGGGVPQTDFRAESLHGFAGVTPQGNVNEGVRNEITKLGLQNHIMTNYTSYVAVDENRPWLLGAAGAVDGMPADPDGGKLAQGPSLQGATNGTIGPQGADVTYVTGVNTAGTVRINNLANIEALLNILANLGELAGILAGSIIAISGMAGWGMVGKKFRQLNVTPAAQITIGLLLIVGGLALPGCINWLVASARDANLFS